MLLQNHFDGTDYSVGQIIGTSIFSGIIAAGATGLSSVIKIPGLNSGRNSYSAISKQIVTKFHKGTISKISYNTFSKMLTLNLIGNFIGSSISGVIDASNLNNIITNWIGDW